MPEISWYDHLYNIAVRQNELLQQLNDEIKKLYEIIELKDKLIENLERQVKLLKG